MSRKRKKADDLGLDMPHESPYEDSDTELVLGPDEYVLVAPLVVAGTRYEDGDKVTLTPRQAEFARGQNCIK